MRLNQRISRTAFLALLVVLLLVQVLTSSELFATTIMFGAAALALSYVIYRAAIAADIRDVTIKIGCTYLLTAVLAAPYLYYILALGVPAPGNSSAVYSNDLLAFVVPTQVLYTGRAFSEVVGHFRSRSVETAAYLGPGLWIILVLYNESSWSTKTGKFLISLSPIICHAMDPSDDNMLRITGDGRKTTLDMRPVDPSAPAHEESKLNRGADLICTLWQTTHSQLSTSWCFATS